MFGQVVGHAFRFLYKCGTNFNLTDIKKKKIRPYFCYRLKAQWQNSTNTTTTTLQPRLEVTQEGRTMDHKFNHAIIFNQNKFEGLIQRQMETTPLWLSERYSPGKL